MAKLYSALWLLLSVFVFFLPVRPAAPHAKGGTAPLGTGSDVMGAPSMEYEEGTLLATVESEEDAQEIASLYGIDLVSVRYGLAVFHTDRDIREVMEQGALNDWPRLEPNWYYQSF